MITQSFDLNLIPESSPVVVHCDQYDKGTGRLVISLYDENIAYSPSGTAKIQGVKPDGKGFEYDASISGNVVTANLTEQMSAVAGRVRCQIVVTETTGRTGTFVFILDVQPSALPLDTDLSESDYQLIEQAIEAAEDAQEYSEDAEAWAVGERGGVPVGPSDPTYENNAEYWSQIAAQYAQGGWHYMGSIPFSQLPTSGMVGGDMYNITDDFVTDSRFIEGAGHQCYAGQNVSWVASVSKWDLPLVPRIVPDMTSSTKGIGRPDGKTTEVSSGVFNAIGVSIPAEVNSGATQYASNWLYYEGTTEVITPSTKQNYRATYNNLTKLYYWTGSEYAELAGGGGGGGGGGDYVGLYGMTEIQSSDGQTTTLLDLDTYTTVGNYFCNGKATIKPTIYEYTAPTVSGATQMTSPEYTGAIFILYVRRMPNNDIIQELYIAENRQYWTNEGYSVLRRYKNSSGWTNWSAEASKSRNGKWPSISTFNLLDVLVNNTADGDVFTRVNGKWSNKPIGEATGLASINTTGATNTTGSTINAGTYFYLDGVLVRAKANIANGASYTLNTNYEVVTAGALNELGYDTGTQDIKYNGTTVGWYRRIGHTVTVYVRYVGNFTTINMTTTLPADCRPPIDLCYALLCGGAGNQLGYFWIRKATGIIELTKAGGTDAGILTCTYLV